MSEATNNFRTESFPLSRIATFDVCDVGKRKHHVAAMIEIDVTESRNMLKAARTPDNRLSFTAWLVKAIAVTIKKHPAAAAYRKGKRELMLFDNINVSLAVEKQLDGRRVPIPLLIEKAQERSIDSISRQIDEAKDSEMHEDDIVLHSRTTTAERLYYWLPGFARRYVWRYMLRHPRAAFAKMGNVAVTSIGLAGNMHGWFLPISVHPICFGISGVAKKPVVVDDAVVIREILSMSILLDHDVIDGADMARFIRDLKHNLEGGLEIRTKTD